MHTSTPLNRDSLRRSVILKDVNNANRSMKLLNNIIHQSPSSQHEVDDELERSIRRTEADIQRRLSNISSTHSPPTGNEKEIRDHFQICLKMFAENKICSKNAWNLRIIDYMRTVLQSQGLAKDSLQVASTSLDASAKIYGIRVDDIHKEGLKLANSMARLGAQKETEIVEDNGNDDQPTTEDGGATKKKKKRKMFGQKITVAKDSNSLVSDIPKLESVFFQTHFNMESSCIDNLFTNKLPTSHSCYKFMLLSKENAWPTYENTDSNVQFDKTFPFKVNELKNFQTCVPFADFSIDEWDPEQEDQLMISQKSNLHEEVVFDAEGIPIPELDGSVHDMFVNHDVDGNMSSEDEEGDVHPVMQSKTVSRIVDFRPEVTDVEANEYSFMGSIQTNNNKLITQIWAGPSHWKLKYVRPAIGRCSAQTDRQPGKSVKKVRAPPAMVDFYNGTSTLDRSKLYKVKRPRIDESALKCTLPEVVINNRTIQRSLMTKDVILTTKIKEPTPSEENENVELYNYQNPNDSLYCSQHAADDDNDNHMDDPDPDLQNDEDLLPTQNFLGDNLIDMPQLAQNTYIPYALQAKKMDMKKLKTAVWKTLVLDKPTQIISEKDMFKMEVNKVQFSMVYKQLPCQISDKMKQELSSPLAFVALLHLCNEQNLLLTETSDRTDLFIEQTKYFIA